MKVQIFGISVIGLSTSVAVAASLSYSTSVPSNSTTAIVVNRSLTDTYYVKDTHRIQLAGSATSTIEKVDIGPNLRGGGYIGYVNVVKRGSSPSGNIVAYRFGRGWQSSIRDMLHGGYHNPTQAGFNDVAGADAKLSTVTNSLGKVTAVNIRKFTLPLFSNAEFDFTEMEDLAPDDRSDSIDQRASDEDGFNEQKVWASGFKGQDSEVRSEFNFEGSYENISELITAENRIPALRHKFIYEFEGKPKSIQQFSVPGGTTNTGDPIFSENWFMKSITNSPFLTSNGGAPALTASDYSGAILSYGIRVFNSNASYKYKYALYYDTTAKAWVNLNLLVSGDRNSLKVQAKHLPDLDASSSMNISVGGSKLSSMAKNSISTAPMDSQGLMVMSTNDVTRPNSGTAIGLYIPKSKANTVPVAGYAANGTRLYVENRRVASAWVPSYNPAQGKIPDQINIVYRSFLSGLYNSDTLTNTKTGVVAEVTTADVVILFGTPNEILKAAKELETKLVD